MMTQDEASALIGTTFYCVLGGDPAEVCTLIGKEIGSYRKRSLARDTLPHEAWYIVATDTDGRTVRKVFSLREVHRSRAAAVRVALDILAREHANAVSRIAEERATLEKITARIAEYEAVVT